MRVPVKQNPQAGGGVVSTDTAEHAPVSWMGLITKNAGFMAQMAGLAGFAPVVRMVPPTKNVVLMAQMAAAVLPAPPLRNLQKKRMTKVEMMKRKGRMRAMMKTLATTEEVLPLNNPVFC